MRGSFATRNGRSLISFDCVPSRHVIFAEVMTSGVGRQQKYNVNHRRKQQSSTHLGCKDIWCVCFIFYLITQQLIRFILQPIYVNLFRLQHNTWTNSEYQPSTQPTITFNFLLFILFFSFLSYPPVYPYISFVCVGTCGHWWRKQGRGDVSNANHRRN